MRYTPNGKPVTSFSIPVEIGYGENKKTVWHRMTAWGKQAEAIAQYAKKGDWLECEGTVDVHAFTDREGNPKASLEVNIKEFNFGPKAGNKPAEPQADAGAPDVDENDLPF